MDTQVRLECRNGNATTRQLCDLSQVIAIEDGTLFKLSDSWFWSTLAWLWRCWRDFIEPVWLFLDYRSCREVTIRCQDDYAVILSNLDSSSANLVRELPSVSIYVTHCLRPRSCRLCHKSIQFRGLRGACAEVVGFLSIFNSVVEDIKIATKMANTTRNTYNLDELRSQIIGTLSKYYVTENFNFNCIV